MVRLPTDESFPIEERFPRQMVFNFQPNTATEMALSLEYASPNPFPNGPIENYRNTGKMQGFTYGQIGDPLTDRTYDENDPYRLHDALHLGMLVQGWSPVLRQLLGLRRRSDQQTDEIADGPRAVLQEEQILNSYGLEHVEQGPLPRNLGRLAADAERQIQPFLPPGTMLPAKVWRDGLVLGGTLMTMLDAGMTGRTSPTSTWVHLNLDTKDIHLSWDSADHARSGTACNMRVIEEALKPRNYFEERYGTMMGIDSAGNAWYLPKE